MDDFDKLLAEMVLVGKAEKEKEKGKKAAERAKNGKKKRLAGSTTPEVTYAVNPWTDEALVLIMYNTKCNNCGNESTSWENNLYVERINRRRRLPIIKIERLEQCHYSCVYGALPKRVEVIQKTSCTCPLCFGIGDSNHDEIMAEISPHQFDLFPLEVKTK